MNQKYYVFNGNGSVSQFFTSENEAIDYVESILNGNYVYDTDLRDLCIVEIKYFVEKDRLVKV